MKAARINSGVCGECEKPCEDVCPNHIPISYMLSNLQASRTTFHDNFKRGDEYQTLEHDFTECDREECGLCEEACPKKIEIIKNLDTYHNLVREYRGRTTVSYGKRYRF